MHHFNSVSQVSTSEGLCQLRAGAGEGPKQEQLFQKKQLELTMNLEVSQDATGILIPPSISSPQFTAKQAEQRS